MSHVASRELSAGRSYSVTAMALVSDKAGNGMRSTFPSVLEELIQSWDGEEVVARYDQPSGTWIFACIHSTRLGPAGGGTRMKSYATPADALQDAMRLSAAMTLKMAAVDLPLGGAKAVLAVPGPIEGEGRRRLLLEYASLVASLGGNFQTGPDVNTSPADMDVIAERCPYVVCRSAETGGAGDPGPHTARGVFHGIRATLKQTFGSDDPSGRRILVQGLGDVGGQLVDQLAAAGARLLVSDLDSERVRRITERYPAQVVPPGEVIGTECDLFAPCALGGILNATTVPRLRCRAVAGSANNQLIESEDGDRLQQAGIIYAPDFVINAGGVLYAWGTESLGWSHETIEARLSGIGDTLTEIYLRSASEGISTAAAAIELATARLQAATTVAQQVSNSPQALSR